MNPRATGTVLVTGASSGIGAAIAARFRDERWCVFGTSRQSRAPSPGIEMVSMDVRCADSVTNAVATVEERAGPVDVLVNNAGATHESLAEETSLETAHAVFETNLFGAVRVSDAVLPSMRARGRGRIVNVGSLAAWVGEPSEAFYAASKAALARYSEALRHETWALGIDVCLLELGAFRTGIMRGADTDSADIADYDPIRTATRAAFQRALRRGADPAVAAAQVWRIATARRPRFRYSAGPDRAVPYLSALLPEALTHHLLRRAFGLPTRRTQADHEVEVPR